MPRLLLPLVVMWSLVPIAVAIQDAKADEALLRKLIQDTAQAINQNDAAGILAHYSKDILVSYPGIPDTTYDVFERSYREMLRPNTSTITVPTIDEILVSGDLATIRMTWSTSITNKETGQCSSRQAKDLQVWRRENGTWKLFRGMWYHVRRDGPCPTKE